MKKTILSLLALALLSGAAMANEKETTYDSLNVRVVWTFHGDHRFAGLAMAPDTTLWTCYANTDTLIQIDASDPEAIDTNFYAIDTAIIGVKEVLDDSMLITISFDGTYFHFQVININLSHPSVVASYVSPHLSNHRGNTASRIINDMYFTMDNTSIGDLAIFDLSDPFNIDTIATAIDRGIGNWFEIIDTLLYVTYFAGSGSGELYSNTYYIRIFNISDIYNPIYDTTLSYITRGATTSVLQCPSVIVDTLMFVAANYYEGPLADVYSIADPTSPVYLGEIGVSSWMYDKYVIDYQNGYLYSGMWIHDVTGYPTSDSLVGYIDGTPKFQEMNGEFIYLVQASSFVILDFYEYDPNHVFVPEIKAPPKPSAFEISAYPNPFNSSVTIAVDCRGLINQTPTVEIFDLNGRKIDVIARRAEPNEAISPNNRSSVPLDTRRDAVSINNCEFVWQPHESLPSGVYLVRARVGGRGDLAPTGQTATKRIVYLK
jgi:hypothetical protein